MPPRPTKKKQPPVLRIDYDGTTYELPPDPGDVPTRIRRELYTQSGLTLQGIGESMGKGQVDEFMMAAFVFVARRMGGQAVTYEAVEGSFDAAKLGDVAVVEAGSPEA